MKDPQTTRPTRRKRASLKVKIAYLIVLMVCVSYLLRERWILRENRQSTIQLLVEEDAQWSNESCNRAVLRGEPIVGHLSDLNAVFEESNSNETCRKLIEGQTSFLSKLLFTTAEDYPKRHIPTSKEISISSENRRFFTAVQSACTPRIKAMRQAVQYENICAENDSLNPERWLCGHDVTYYTAPISVQVKFADGQHQQAFETALDIIRFEQDQGIRCGRPESVMWNDLSVISTMEMMLSSPAQIQAKTLLQVEHELTMLLESTPHPLVHFLSLRPSASSYTDERADGIPQWLRKEGDHRDKQSELPSAHGERERLRDLHLSRNDITLIHAELDLLEQIKEVCAPNSFPKVCFERVLRLA